MTIRAAQIEDEEKISKLIAHFRVELKELKRIKTSPNIQEARKEFKEYIEAKFPIFVAEDSNNELLGYIVCRVDGAVIWAESLFVSNSSRRKGIGSRLYQEAEKLAKDLGGDTVYNWVHPNNDKIIPFLMKRGYNVLNLIEIRKPLQGEVLDQKINIGKYEYNY